MLDQGKYVVGTSPLFNCGNRPVAIIFDERITHAKMAQALNMEVHSAGNVQVIGKKVSVYGESTTIGVRSNPDDVTAVSKALGFDKVD